MVADLDPSSVERVALMAWTDQRLDDLANRTDAGFEEVKVEFRELRQEIKHDFQGLRQEIKNDSQQLRLELKDDIGKLDAKFDAKLDRLGSKFDRLQVAIIVGLITLIGTSVTGFPAG